MVEWEIERREACDALFVTLDQIQAVSGPPMTPEEIGAEIKAARIGS